MEASLIYTFNSKDQEFGYRHIDKESLENEYVFKEFALKGIDKEDRGDLCKISACLELGDNEGEEDIPLWFKECMGKIWFD